MFVVFFKLLNLNYKHIIHIYIFNVKCIIILFYFLLLLLKFLILYVYIRNIIARICSQKESGYHDIT